MKVASAGMPQPLLAFNKETTAKQLDTPLNMIRVIMIKSTSVHSYSGLLHRSTGSGT
jgi:hypothetical protein